MTSRELFWRQRLRRMAWLRYGPTWTDKQHRAFVTTWLPILLQKEKEK